MEHYDATNSVRLCDRCEGEQGIAAGADAGDRACSACGQRNAPHIYPALAPASSGQLDLTAYEWATFTARWARGKSKLVHRQQIEDRIFDKLEAAYQQASSGGDGE